jgi:hypothetical protein
MATSPRSTAKLPEGRSELRIELRAEPRAGSVDGAWWPRSRDFQVEAADLVDHFPAEGQRIQRLLFSRPDWDDVVVDGRGLRRIQARRGPVKVGSFPSDDTHMVILTMSSDRRLTIRVLPPEMAADEARRAMQAAVT